MKELEARKAIKQIANDIIKDIDKTEDLVTFIDGIIGALLGMKIFMEKEKK